MKTTPLKKPITVTFDSVERAVMYSHLSEDVANGRTISERAKKMNDILRQTYGLSAATQIRQQLDDQGINWRSWEPKQSITIGSYQVEFKPGHINVGCKSITNETVRAILDRLEGKMSHKNLNAVINTYGSDELAQSVQVIAFQNGLKWEGGGNEIRKEHVKMIGIKDGRLSYWSIESEPSRAGSGWNSFPVLDARTQFGVILDTFKRQDAIKIQGDPVKFESGSIVIEGHRVITATVKEIVKQLI